MPSLQEDIDCRAKAKSKHEPDQEQVRIENALRVSEERLRVIMEYSPDPIYLKDRKSRILLANPACTSAMGKTLKEIIGKNDAEIYADKQIGGTILETDKRVMASRKATVVEEEIVTPFGRRIYLSTKTPWLDSDGKVIGLMGISRDITERKKTEEALMENQLNLNLAQQIAKVGNWVWNFNTNKLEWSDELYRILGLKPKEIPASLENWLSFIPIQEREENKKEIEKQTNDPSPYPHEQKILLKDGSLRWVSVTTKNIVADDGRIIKTYGTVQDITECKKNKEALKESERFFKTIFDNSEDGFMLVEILFDNSGKPIDQKYLKVNQAFCKQTGIKEKYIVGKTLRQVLPKIEPSWYEIADQVLQTGKPLHTENYNQDTCRYYDLYCFPFAEKTVGALFRDITDRKSLEKQLQEKERFAAIGATAGMVGHDIRNPLQAIAGDLFLIDNDVASLPEGGTKEGLQESVKSIQDNLQYIAKIVEDLQDYAKALKPNFERVKIDKVIEDVMLLMHVTPNHRVIIDVEKNFPEILVDFSMLKRALTNLTQNAIQAMPNGGQLTLRASHEGNHVFICVEDTGEGIPEGVKPKLFTPMVTTKSKGQGLGLAVVKRLVEALNGTITFESQEGKGTKFTIELPIIKSQ